MPLCVPLSLKKPGDFTVSEGIRLQMFRFFGGWVWSERKKKSRHGRIVSDRHRHPLGGMGLEVWKKKRQARVDCVRPSRAPTTKYKLCVCLSVHVCVTRHSRIWNCNSEWLWKTQTAVSNCLP